MTNAQVQQMLRAADPECACCRCGDCMQLLSHVKALADERETLLRLLEKARDSILHLKTAASDMAYEIQRVLSESA